MLYFEVFPNITMNVRIQIDLHAFLNRESISFVQGLVEEKIGALVMKQVSERTLLRRRPQAGIVLSPDELARLLPSGWPTDIPLVRIYTCGLLAIEVLREVRHDANGDLVLVYEAPNDDQLQRKGNTTALNLLKLLISQPGRFATKDWLLEKLHRSRGDTEEWGGLARFDNVVSLLRGLLCSQGMPGEKHLRKVLVECLASTPESGTSYRLARFPLIWLDVEAMGIHVRQAQEFETAGQNAFPSWKAAYDIGKRGPFLADAPYSDWAARGRGESESYLWQSVQALWRHHLSLPGNTGEEEALRLLQEYWLEHIDNERAFLPLLNLLAKREDYQLAEKYYEMFCEASEKAEQCPDQRIEEAMAYMREHQRQARLGQYSIVVHSQLSLEPTHADISRSLQEMSLNEPALGVMDWGEAPSLEQFYGREEERTTLTSWIIENPCRLVTIVGMGGIGKTSLAVALSNAVKASFDYVFWRSLQHAPRLRTILEECLKFLSNQQQTDFPDEINDLILQVLNMLREHRCLLVLDNCETVMQSGVGTGLYRNGYEDYGQFFRRVGETQHQGCLLLTSREKPREIALLEGKNSSVHSYHLQGLKSEDGINIVQDKGLVGSLQAMEKLIDFYAGNPLALKLVSQFIHEVFQGSVTAFLQDGQVVFSDIQEVLDQQVQRLSSLEQEIMYWLAIEREAVSLQKLSDNFISSPTRKVLQDAIQSLRRRYLIESNTSGFLLQNVVMEYMTEHLVVGVCEELRIGHLSLLENYALMLAQAKEYIRESQVRLIIQPLMRYMRATFGKEGSEILLKSLLATIRTTTELSNSYAAGNILNLLILMRYDLHGYDFSHLTIRQAYLRGVSLQGNDFTASYLSDCVFTEAFGAVLSVVFSPDGKLIAAGTANGEVRIWQFPECQLKVICRGHTDWVRSVAFSPDGSMLASGSEDQAIRLWIVETGQCFGLLQGHTSWIRAVVFGFNGRILASCGDDRTIRIWDVQNSQSVSILQGHTQKIWSIAFHPDGHILASGSEDQTIRLWDTATGSCLSTMQATNAIYSVAFSLDGYTLASGNESGNVELWNVETSQCLSILQGHTDRVRSVIFHPNGLCASGSDDRNIRIWNTTSGECIKSFQGHANLIWSLAFAVEQEDCILASGSHDQTIRIWNAQNGECLTILQGHTNWIRSLAFAPNGLFLASDNSDQTIQLWNIQTNLCQHVFRGHTNLIWSLAFSPHGHILASGSEDQTVRIWNIETGRCLHILQGHTSWVRTVSFSPNQDLLASGSEDGTIKLWNLSTGTCDLTLRGQVGWIRSVAFSPDGKTLASGSDDQTICLWNVETGQRLQDLQSHNSWVWSVAFSPDGTLLASGSHDQTIRIWEISTGQCLKILTEHSDWVWSVAFSPDGTLLASGSHDQTIRIWEISTGQCRTVLRGHTSWVWSVVFSPDGTLLASGSNDGTIKLWNILEGRCTNTLKNEKPYENMNITRITGLTTIQKAALFALGAVETL